MTLPLSQNHAPIELSDNEKLVVAIVWHDKQLSRGEITTRVPFTQQSTHRIVEALLEKKVLVLGDPIAKGRGKPSPSVRINARQYYSLGLSFIKGKGIYLRISDLTGEAPPETRLAIDNQYSEKVFEQLHLAVKHQLEMNNIEIDQVLGIGVALPSYRQKGNGEDEVFEAFGNWPKLDYATVLSQQFSLPVWVDNSANCSAIAELMLGRGKEFDSFVYLSFGYGYGSGLVWRNELMSGGLGNAGQIGRTFTSDERPYRPAMANLVQYLSDHNVDVNEDLEQVAAKNMPLVVNWYQEVEPMLIRSLRSFLGVFDPSAVVIGGHAPNSVKQLFEITINKVIGEQILVGYPTPELYYSSIAIEGEAKGASLLPIKKILMVGSQ
ncbi:ROK family protein [Vibrio comitans]|uniref:Xylose repressor n=1 Tax=Vibrio comitans NBRC 102076 TaxID=1219078 RepID=A0A4Y3ILD2_9VIBR|nr:ROK family protein [Vibrio comitans]GEA60147.1 xylose repressor [Vibrio comitans NBRC 102076]